jgi:hypothetical protein
LEFKKLLEKYQETRNRDNDTVEKIFEFKIHSVMRTLLDVLYAFEIGDREIFKKFDYHELLGELKQDYNILKQNIENLESNK